MRVAYRMTGPDWVVMCNLINIHTHTPYARLPSLGNPSECHVGGFLSNNRHFFPLTGGCSEGLGAF